MASTWQVTSQTPDQVIRGGIPVDGYDITVTLGDNEQVSVEVDLGQYADLATLKHIIQAAVDLHDSVAALSGP